MDLLAVLSTKERAARLRIACHWNWRRHFSQMTSGTDVRSGQLMMPV